MRLYVIYIYKYIIPSSIYSYHSSLQLLQIIAASLSIFIHIYINMYIYRYSVGCRFSDARSVRDQRGSDRRLRIRATEVQWCCLDPGRDPWRIRLVLVPSGYVKIAIENGHRNSEFSHWTWWFSIAMLVYQRVYVLTWLGYIDGKIWDPWRLPYYIACMDPSWGRIYPTWLWLTVRHGKRWPS